MSLVGALAPKIRNLILVKYAGKTAADLCISDGQYYYLSKDPYLPLERLQSLLQDISNIDLQLKSGLLDIPKDAQIDYVLAKLCK
jgi:hypothetical protein